MHAVYLRNDLQLLLLLSVPWSNEEKNQQENVNRLHFMLASATLPRRAGP